jgi:hypothetical protein
MSLKQLVFLVDDFTENSVDYYRYNYGNVTYFDYTFLTIERHWDFDLDGYFDHFQRVSNIGYGYNHVIYDSSAEWAYAIDNDYYTDWRYGFNTDFGIYGFYKEAFTNYGHQSSSNDIAQHGDWVLYSFMEQLYDPSAVEIILIDVDSSSGYLNPTQLNALFNLKTSIFSGLQVTLFEETIETFFEFYADPNTLYLPTVFSYSAAGLPTINQLYALSVLEALGVVIVQSVPNVNQGYFNWSQFYEDVVSVGAWNVDTSNRLLAGDISVLNTVDLYANGYIFNPVWGSNFGTSFSAPRVSAEIVNFLHFLINYVDWENLTLEEVQAAAGIDYSDLVAFLIDSIARDLSIDLNNVTLDEPISVMTSDLTNSLYPSVVSGATGIEGLVLTQVAHWNMSPVGSVTISGTTTQGQTLTASNNLSDADGLGPITYTWYASGSDSPIGEGGSYTLTQAEVGKTITVKASYTDGGGTSESVVSAATVDVAEPQVIPVFGKAYHWKSHALLSGVEVVASSKPVGGTVGGLFELRAIGLADDRAMMAELWVNLGASVVENLDVMFEVDSGVSITFVLNSTISGWTLIDGNSASERGTEFTLGGFAGSGASALTGSVKLGDISLDRGADQTVIDVRFLSGEAGDLSLLPYQMRFGYYTDTTGADGTYEFGALPEGTYEIDLSKALTSLETGNVISSADALAALKIAVGRNPNTDPDGDGPLSAPVVSPYQFI